jgi:hypothetical protein
LESMPSSQLSKMTVPVKMSFISNSAELPSDTFKESGQLVFGLTKPLCSSSRLETAQLPSFAPDHIDQNEVGQSVSRRI